MSGRGLNALFEPQSIAVLGASTDASRIGGKPIANLLRFGFRGPVYPINLRQSVVQGLPAYQDIASIPGPVDLAVLAIPAAGTLDALEACAKAGVGAAIVFASGFGEVGAEGEAAQVALGALAQRTGMRVLGPNCLGAMNVASGAVCTFGQAAHGGLPPAGGLSFVSQSGAFGTFTFVTAVQRGLPASRWVTTGNEADIQAADCIDWLADDPATEVIMAYLEGCRDGPRLIRALQRAQAAGKPVVIMKVGRSNAGAAAAQSHTAALAGADVVYDAVLRQYGAHRAKSVDEFLDVGYAALKGRRPTGRKLGIITMSGGAGVLMADAADDAGLDVWPLTDATQAKMRSILPYAGVQNPVDVTGQIANDPTLYTKFGTVMLEEGGYDAIVGFHAVGGLDPEYGGTIADTWEQLRAHHPDVPVFLSMLSTPALRGRLERLQIPVFDEPGRMVHAVAALARFAPSTPDLLSTPNAPVLTGAVLSEVEASDMLSRSGITMVDHRVVSSAEAAVAAADAMGYPVVLKLVSPDVAHKTEIGGVLLNLPNGNAVSQAHTTILAKAAALAPSARIDGVMVAPMLHGGVEMIAGIQRDPVFGPIVMLGLGGVFVEVRRDVAFRHAPVGPVQARAMIAELRGVAMLDGARGQAPSDRDALADLLVCLSRFAADNIDQIESVEINPLLVCSVGEGVVGLDALII